jgi:hypothetical protein
MNGDHDARMAKNETVFRDVNERIEAGALPADTGKLLAFCCECARLGCNQLVEVTIATYELVRASPRRFLLAVGHEFDDVEKVVSRGAGYIVVEKIGEAGRVAQALDPRDDA